VASSVLHPPHAVQKHSPCSAMVTQVNSGKQNFDPQIGK
jgi:hypothetical protein